MRNSATLGLTGLLLGAIACGRVGFGALGDARGDGANAPIDTPPILPPGAIAWWRLDEGVGTTVNDSIGTANGMLVAGVTSLPTWSVGHLGAGLHFAGNGDLVGFGGTAALVNLPALSIAAWVNPSGLAVLPQCIVDHGDVGIGWYFPVSQVTATDLSFVAQYPTNTVSRSSPPGMIPADVWTHVIATWDGGTLATGIHLFANGVEVPYAGASNATGTRGDDSSAGFALNCNNGGRPGYGGILDDVRVWKRVLSPSEAQALYELTK